MNDQNGHQVVQLKWTIFSMFVLAKPKFLQIKLKKCLQQMNVSLTSQLWTKFTTMFNIATNKIWCRNLLLPSCRNGERASWEEVSQSSLDKMVQQFLL